MPEWRTIESLIVCHVHGWIVGLYCFVVVDCAFVNCFVFSVNVLFIRVLLFGPEGRGNKAKAEFLRPLKAVP